MELKCSKPDNLQRGDSVASGDQFSNLSAERSSFRGVGFWLGIGAIGLSSIFGCKEKPSAEKNSASPPAPTSFIKSDSVTTKSATKPKFEIVYDLPITCPKGSEFIPDGARARLNPEQTNIINAAHYLWKSALADNATARDALAKKIPVAPGPELMPKDDPFYGPIEAALSPLDLKAAYVHGVVTTEDVTTKAQQNIPFRLFSFRGVSADTSFFALVGSIGHEFHHAIQGEHDDPLKVGSSFQQTAWREMDAYRQEVTDLERVAVFLRNSPEIPNDLRERHLKSWLTDLAGQVYNASFYNHRFKVQYLASAISTSLGNIDAFLKKQNLSEQGPTIIALQSELAPLLEYKKDLPIDTAKLEETLKRVESFVNSTPALSSKASVEIAKRTEKFLASVTELRQAVPDYLVAQERLQRWGENPAPLP